LLSPKTDFCAAICTRETDLFWARHALPVSVARIFLLVFLCVFYSMHRAPHQTRSVLESESAASQPSDADLDAAFTVADEDGNGVVDEDEFVRLMRLVKKGEVQGDA
jgi:hypothetical protein